MKTLKTIWNFFFTHKTASSKQRIENSMIEKYGIDWFEKCIEGLKNPNIRVSLKETLKL